MSAVAIHVKRCAKTFADGTRALEALDLDILPGETLVLLGPSGCGKTTTLRLIAGLEYPDTGGEVWFGDENVTTLPIEKRGVGMVFQSYALFPNMSVAANIGYGLRIRKVAREVIARKVAEMVALVHLEGLEERRIDQLSGGQKQRVALARALAVEPRVLLLDEPLTALDAKLRETLRVDINALLRGLGITAVYVTHDQGEAMALGDRIVVMDRGRIAQIGSPQEIYHRPANAVVANFIGTMNRVSGVARDGWFELAGGRVPLRGLTASETIQFRPEDVELVETDPHFSAEVAAAFFLGDHTRLLLKLDSAETLIVDTTRRLTWAVGARVGLRLAEDAILISS